MSDCKVEKSQNSSNKINSYEKQLENFDITNCKCVDFSKLNFTLKNFEENFEKNFFSMSLKIKEDLNVGNKTEIFDYIKKNTPQLSLFFPDIRYNNKNNSDSSTIELILKMKDLNLDNTATKILDLNFGKIFYEDFTKYFDDVDNGNIKIIIFLIIFAYFLINFY